MKKKLLALLMACGMELQANATNDQVQRNKTSKSSETITSSKMDSSSSADKKNKIKKVKGCDIAELTVGVLFFLGWFPLRIIEGVRTEKQGAFKKGGSCPMYLRLTKPYRDILDGGIVGVLPNLPELLLDLAAVGFGISVARKIYKLYRFFKGDSSKTTTTPKKQNTLNPKTLLKEEKSET